MKNMEVKTKTLITYGGAILVFIIAIVAIVLLVNNRGGKNSQESKFISRIEEMGKAFYEDFYYPYTGNDDTARAQAVKEFETLGIKVSLANLSRYNTEDSKSVLDEFVNSKTNKACDKDNTRAIIYPTSPYGKKDYKIEVQLDCGFDSKNENK